MKTRPETGQKLSKYGTHIKDWYGKMGAVYSNSPT